MTRQNVTFNSQEATMTKFGYILNREPTKFVSLNRDATKIIALNREATRYNNFNNPEKVKPIINNRKGERTEKKWQIRGWEVDDCTDDGIVTWMKKQTQIGGKRGTKKKQIATETDYIIPASNRCPQIDDSDLFVKQSLHVNFLPKEQIPITKARPTCVKEEKRSAESNNDNADVDKKEENERVGVGVITPVGFTERFENVIEGSDRDKIEIAHYKESKSRAAEDGGVRERRSRSVPEGNSKNNRDKADQRSTAYHKIKRFLKLAKYDDRRFSMKLEEDDDEGYASKTSSAETKEGSNSESDAPAELQRMYSSMIDLSELPSQEKEKENNNKEPESKIKFSYTHQASILQIPAPQTKLQLQKERPERIDTNKTYTRLKREKELRRCASTLYEPQHVVETSTMYDLNTIKPVTLDINVVKPVTLVLRKISIQDSEQRITSIIPGGRYSPPGKQNVSQSQPSSRANSRANSRIGSAASRVGSAVSRSSSVMSKTSTLDRSPRVPISRPCSRLAMHKDNNTTKTKEPTWCPKHSHVTLFDRQQTYSIGDLLPAVDKSIYNKQIHVNRSYDSAKGRSEHNTPDLADKAKSPQDDGYMLLQKGMDILTGNTEKQTLGPPAFRPNQTRHPLIRNVTVIVEPSDRFSPIQVGTRPKVRSPQARVSSDKGPRPNMFERPNMYEDRETQKKLKEAFTRFYQNRPKDIGKEFRRMQTMWKA